MSCCAPCKQQAAMAGLLDVVWPSDVEAYAVRVDVTMRATHAAVMACGGLATEERKAWSDFYDAWRKFFGEVAGSWVFGGGGKNEEIKRYESQLAQWQGILRAKCMIPGPVPKPRQEEDRAATDDVIGTVKWVAFAVGVAAVAWGVRSVLR